jgi:hypothetical protein
VLAKELPQRGCTGVAEDGVWSAGEHGSHPPPLLVESRVPDGVHATMNAMHLLRPYAPGQALAVNAQAVELRHRYHAMLIGRKTSDMGCVGEFLTHVRE